MRQTVEANDQAPVRVGAWWSAAKCGRGRERERSTYKKGRKIMSKRAKAVCVKCNTHDGLFIVLRNGERLPSYTIKIGGGIICNQCKGEGK